MERELGIGAGLMWIGAADALVVYTDYGVSLGMQRAIKHATGIGVPIEYRTLAEDVKYRTA